MSDPKFRDVDDEHPLKERLGDLMTALGAFGPLLPFFVLGQRDMAVGARAGGMVEVADAWEALAALGEAVVVDLKRMEEEEKRRG
ncbi:hypothetical protein [Nocardioides sp. AE5]|uniref:hypothetical protein n=1 Tax=Nocardioides sp. AE5 TaxID=2962573 RepID=UPI002880DFB4|nr:hypothetical protein [Nocardioides sp. AE5]MDT0201351.1 hypothetical protein [Nocardioides sp. AE5]